MASLAATNWPKPISLVPCLSWSTASPVFTQGVMSNSINWSLLQSQYFSDTMYQNDLAKMVKIIDQDVRDLYIFILNTYVEIILFQIDHLNPTSGIWLNFCSFSTLLQIISSKFKNFLSYSKKVVNFSKNAFFFKVAIVFFYFISRDFIFNFLKIYF